MSDSMRGGFARLTTLAAASMIAVCAADARAGDIVTSRPHAIDPIVSQRTLFAPLSQSSTLHYFGGKVIPRVQVVVVLWGSNVSSTVSNDMGSFYSAITASPYMDWLGEYDTAGHNGYDGKSGSNQHVYRGTYLSTVTIKPSSSSNSVQDSDIASELDSQIAAKVLPAPTLDSEGGVDTLYMVYFPSGDVIYDGQGGTSCNGGSSNAFCGYHSTFQATVGNQTVSIPYGVIPDMSSSGCSYGCGGNSALEDYTITSSHEMVESITDAEIGIAPGVARPMAWYDTYNGEIGDMCENQSGFTDTIGGYTVQKIWSQRLGKCIAQDPSLPLCGSQRPCRPCTSADDGGACNGATPVCETSSASSKQGQCVACTSSSQCSGAAPVCDGSTDVCRGCQSDGECGSGKCDTATGACVACTSNDDCTSASAAICDSSTHTCRGCSGNADCQSPAVCDSNAGACVGCQSNADCANPNLPICDSSSHTCEPDPNKSKSDGGAGSTSHGDAGTGNGDDGTGWGSSSSGCSTSPGRGGGPFGAGLGVALALAAARRRRHLRC